jgi:hypothetical protein
VEADEPGGAVDQQIVRSIGRVGYLGFLCHLVSRAKQLILSKLWDLSIINDWTVD